MMNLIGATKKYFESPACQESLLPFAQWITARHKAHGGITEVRILGGPNNRKAIWCGYFDHEHWKDMIRTILPKPNSPRAKTPFGDYPRIEEGNIYFSLRPVHPDLLGRIANKIQYADQTTSDADIVAYDMFAVDIDPERKSQISSSDEEKHSAYLVASAIKKWLAEEGVKALWADSGNGYHLLVPTIPYRGDDLARATEDSGLLLHFLAEHFNGDQARVDLSIYNPARILRLYGTLTMKGSNLADKRPHRWSSIDLKEIPEDIDLFGKLRGTLDDYKKEVRERQKPKPSLVRTATTISGDKRSWSRDESIAVLEGVLVLSGLNFRKEEKGGRVLFIFERCPHHQDDDGHQFECCTMVEADGRYSASCKHDADAHWQHFKSAIAWEKHKEGVLKSLGLWRGRGGAPKAPEPPPVDVDAELALIKEKWPAAADEKERNLLLTEVIDRLVRCPALERKRAKEEIEKITGLKPKILEQVFSEQKRMEREQALLARMEADSPKNDYGYSLGPERFFNKKGNFLPNTLAREILGPIEFLSSPIDDAGKGVRLLAYSDGVFRNGESLARSVSHRILDYLSKPSYIEATVALIKESTKLDEEALNPQAMDLVNVENGMLDWKTGKLLPHSSEYRSTFRIHAAYDPQAQSPTVERFLTEVFPPDALALNDELLGYLLRPTTKYQKAGMLIGPGSNGKSTYLAAVLEFLGRENVSHVALQDMGENRFSAAELLGKLANIYPDLPATALEQSDVFKAVVSGDDIKAERKFQHPFTLRAFARLLFSANELPPSKDLTHAFFRRWIIIPFFNKFEGKKADKNLVEKLTTPEARSVLLNHAIAGLRRLEAQQGFTECPSVLSATEKYRKQCDNVYEFSLERLRISQGNTVMKEEIYKAYSEWCAELGIPHPVSQKSFNKRLTEILGVREGREIMPDGKKHRVWLGLGWKDEADSSQGEGADRLGPERPGPAYFSSSGAPTLTAGREEGNGVNGEKLEEPGIAGPTRSNGQVYPVSEGENQPLESADSTQEQAEFDLMEGSL